MPSIYKITNGSSFSSNNIPSFLSYHLILKLQIIFQFDIYVLLFY
jgi:hypothetical protein